VTYVADLHLHSPFARATSRELNFENLSRWAGIKGIDLLASADFTHPAWFEETRRKLREAGDGLYEYDGVRFVLGTEVNCTTHQGGRNRRVHLLVFAPSLEVVERVNAALGSKGNLASDGRLTVKLSPRDLASTLLEIDSRCLLIPAHVWTPWFGIFGSKSGFDSLQECFGDMTPHIYAVETGLSSEPAMNWRIPELDSLSIVSFSDAHSLPNMGRELTVMRGDLSYDGLVESLRTQDIAYTVEFFPEEGKYHHSGHRKCGVKYSPGEVQRYGRRCPSCGRPLTVGVMQRVEELAAREVDTWTDEDGYTRAENNRPPFKMLVSLSKIIAEGLGKGTHTKAVRTEYDKLVTEFESELSVLTEAPVAEVATVSGERIAEGIARVRRGAISVEPGYDGMYGTVTVWPDEDSGLRSVPGHCVSS
jgi:uncharacterized protein (TIGR00375 family)